MVISIYWPVLAGTGTSFHTIYFISTRFLIVIFFNSNKYHISTKGCDYNIVGFE